MKRHIVTRIFAISLAAATAFAVVPAGIPASITSGITAGITSGIPAGISAGITPATVDAYAATYSESSTSTVTTIDWAALDASSNTLNSVGSGRFELTGIKDGTTVTLSTGTIQNSNIKVTLSNGSVSGQTSITKAANGKVYIDIAVSNKATGTADYTLKATGTSSAEASKPFAVSVSDGSSLTGTGTSFSSSVGKASTYSLTGVKVVNSDGNTLSYGTGAGTVTGFVISDKADGTTASTAFTPAFSDIRANSSDSSRIDATLSITGINAGTYNAYLNALTLSSDGKTSVVAASVPVTITVSEKNTVKVTDSQGNTLASEDNLTLDLAKNKTEQLKVSATQSSRITYTSSNSAIASVSDAGLITAVAAGSTTVTVYADNVKVCTISVTVNAYPSATITVKDTAGNTLADISSAKKAGVTKSLGANAASAFKASEASENNAEILKAAGLKYITMTAGSTAQITAASDAAVPAFTSASDAIAKISTVTTTTNAASTAANVPSSTATCTITAAGAGYTRITVSSAATSTVTQGSYTILVHVVNPAEDTVTTSNESYNLVKGSTLPIAAKSANAASLTYAVVYNKPASDTDYQIGKGTGLNIDSTGIMSLTSDFSADTDYIVKITAAATAKSSATTKYILVNATVKNAAVITVPSEKITVAEGAQAAIGATVTGYTGALTYTSDDTSIATVDAAGTVTGVKAGTAVITVAAGSVKTNVAVVVSKKAIEIPQVTMKKVKNLKGNRIKISWNRATGAAGYQVSVKQKGKKAQKYTVDTASTTYVRVDINPSKTYHVKVRAFRYNDTDDSTSQVKEYGQYSKSVKIRTDKK